MRDADRAIVREAMRDTAPVAVLALLACGALSFGVMERLGDVRIPTRSTWSLLPLVAVAAWAGIGVMGEFRGTMAHALARPVHRGRLLMLRTGVVAAMLGMVAVVLRLGSWLDGPLGDGPPLALMVGAIAVALGIGTLAGAAARTETGAVGGAVVGVVVALSPILMLLDGYDVSMPRLTSVLGGWLWPVALSAATCLVWPTWHVVGRLPQRSARPIAVAVVTAFSLHAVALAAIWWPIAWRATWGEHGERLAIAGALNGPHVVYTGTHGRLDGVYVDRGDSRLTIFGEGARRDIILDAELSPDGRAIALLVQHPGGELRHVVLVDLESGERLNTVWERHLELGAWAPQAHEMAFLLPGKHTPIAIASLERSSVRRLAATPDQYFGRITGWHGDTIVAERHHYDHIVVHRVPASGEGERQTIEVGRGRRAVSPFGVAWVQDNPRRGAPKMPPYRTLTIRGWEPNAEPVTVELDAWANTRVAGVGFVDADHVFVELMDGGDARGNRDNTKRLSVVHRSGEVRVSLERTEGFGISKLQGPPQGPWLALGVYGRVMLLDRDGRTLSDAHARNLGGRSRPWIPTRRIPGGIAFIDRGRLATMQLEGTQ